MTPRFRVSHRTEYRYGTPMIDGYTMAHLLPRATPYQQVVAAEVLIDPTPTRSTETVDLFGNRVVRSPSTTPTIT